MTNFERVQEFHRVMDLAVGCYPTYGDNRQQKLRLRLIAEKTSEVIEAMIDGDVYQVAKELADLLYVTYGAAVQLGINIDAVFAEVHRSNMTKVGGGVRADGKLLKPAGYQPAKLTAELLASK